MTERAKPKARGGFRAQSFGFGVDWLVLSRE